MIARLEDVKVFSSFDKNNTTFQLTLTTEGRDETTFNELNKLSEDKAKVKFEFKKYRERRSLDANGLLWECLGRMAVALRTDKWELYLDAIKKYGKFTYVCVIPKAVEDMKEQFRACEEVGEININGRKAIQLLCYFGSSTYDTKEFSVLLDGVISDMRECGIKTPLDEELEGALEEWSKNCGK